VNGQPLPLQRHGRGPALVLLHGFTGSAQGMARLAESFEDRYEVLVPDLPGHGRSTVPAGYGFDAAVSDLLATLAASGHRQACWFGYSMGARLALACAARDPGCAAALVLVGARAGIADPAEREARRRQDEALAARIESAGLEAFVDEWMAQPLFATQRRLGESFLAAARCERLAHAPEGLAASLRALGPGAQPPLLDALGQVAAPTLLVAGALDGKFVAAAHDLARRLPRAEVCEIADAGHAAHLERPGAFLAAAREFLRRSPAPAQPASRNQVQETAS
jgi:2-succinyl-6-hydroxy-2,4-cyclohexadiene-1-carboxylate synthase